MVIKKYLPYLLVPVTIIVIWFILTTTKSVSPVFLPLPQQVLLQAWKNARELLFWKDVIATLYRIVIGFSIGVLIGTPLGLLMGSLSFIYKSLDFTIDFVRSIPSIALFPLFLLVFGIDDLVKISVAAWGTTLIMVINAMHGVHGVKELRLKAGRIMNLSPYLLITKMIIPESLPNIFTGLRLALSLAFVIVVATEMFIGTQTGLGHRILQSQLSYELEDMYATILYTGMFGFLLNRLIILLEKYLIHWKGKN